MMKLRPFYSLVKKYIGAETLRFYPIHFGKGYHLQSLRIIEMAIRVLNKCSHC